VQYDELTKHMPYMFFSLDRSLVYTSFNKACEKFMGKSAEDVIGKTVAEVFPAGPPVFFSDYKEVLATGKAKNLVSAFTLDENTFTYIVNIQI
jgi:PAS domain S-box-containing protein